MNKTLIVVVGPTGIGKTALAIAVAQHFNTEILSADSRQFYREMSIGTAVPSTDELKAAPHHFIQHISMLEDYNVGQFEKDAIALLDDLFIKKDVVVLVGGSGLYVDAVIHGLDTFPEVTFGLRQKLKDDLETAGLRYLQDLLKHLDPEYYEQVDINNTQRILRALEVCISSGKPYSSFLTKHNIKRSFQTIKIGLTASREKIYARINARVDLMMGAGLENEARSLFAHKHLNALNTVGYKELFDHFKGLQDLPEAIEEIKKNTRRFAKRQLTWYRRDESIFWFEHDTNFIEIIKAINKKTS